MPILIDGYNYLHATGIFADEVGPGSVEKLHAALLDFLIGALDPSEVPQTTVVFDARGRRAGSRRMHRHGDITVHYASRHEDADALLAELICQHTAPRRLTVVSSDHQVQRAARRRRAKAVDSHVWHAELLRRRKDRLQIRTQPAAVKPSDPLSEHDAAWWLTQFGPELLAELAEDPGLPTPPSPARSVPAKPPHSAQATAHGVAPASGESFDEEKVGDDELLSAPFPPSYLAAIQNEILADESVPPRPKSRLGRPTQRRRKRNSPP